MSASDHPTIRERNTKSCASGCRIVPSATPWHRQLPGASDRRSRVGIRGLTPGTGLVRPLFRPVAAPGTFLVDSRPHRLLDDFLRGGCGIMASYVALLRAVNVGGTGKLPMSDLKAICEKAGFGKVRTYIASGNVVFESREDEARVRRPWRPPWPPMPGSPSACSCAWRPNWPRSLRTTRSRMRHPTDHGHFPGRAAMSDALERITGKNGEDVRLGRREIYVHYGDGMANSKLKIPDAKAGTARNINTVSRLAGMVAEA